MLGQIDWDEGECRVIDARGDGFPRGALIPLAPACRSTVRRGGAARRQRSRGAGPAKSRASPSDAANGSVVGLLGRPPGRAVRRRRAPSAR